MTITRRDFLKLSSAGLLALALSDVHLEEARALEAPTSFQGRATLSGIQIYQEPSFYADTVRSRLNKDEVVDILAQTTGDGTYNRVWYRIDRGYTYSGWLQPVRTTRQPSVMGLTRAPMLGEITVPFAETRRDLKPKSDHAYRAYYGTTYWVGGAYPDEDGNYWYEVFDKQIELGFYISAFDMRLVPDEELSPLSTDVPDEEKLIHVDLRTQYVTAFEGERMVYRSRCSSGAGPKTPLGDFLTYHKGPSIHMTNEGDSEAHIYNLPGVPWVTFFSGNGEAFHGTYWHNDFGKPRSHGCINLPNSAAKFIYRWTSPVVPPGTDYLYQPKTGTKVHIVKPEV